MHLKPAVAVPVLQFDYRQVNKIKNPLLAGFLLVQIFDIIRLYVLLLQAYGLFQARPVACLLQSLRVSVLPQRSMSKFL